MEIRQKGEFQISQLLDIPVNENTFPHGNRVEPSTCYSFYRTKEELEQAIKEGWYEVYTYSFVDTDEEQARLYALACKTRGHYTAMTVYTEIRIKALGRLLDIVHEIPSDNDVTLLRLDFDWNEDLSPAQQAMFVEEWSMARIFIIPQGSDQPLMMDDYISYYRDRIPIYDPVETVWAEIEALIEKHNKGMDCKLTKAYAKAMIHILCYFRDESLIDNFDPFRFTMSTLRDYFDVLDPVKLAGGYYMERDLYLPEKYSEPLKAIVEDPKAMEQFKNIEKQITPALDAYVKALATVDRFGHSIVAKRQYDSSDLSDP